MMRTNPITRRSGAIIGCAIVAGVISLCGCPAPSGKPPGDDPTTPASDGPPPDANRPPDDKQSGNGMTTPPTQAIPATSEKPMSVTKTTLGQTSGGTPIEQYTLTSGSGVEVDVMTYGATITRVAVPDRDGNVTNVTLHLDSLDDYLDGHPCLGSVCGRYANRIARGRFTLDGVEDTLATNAGDNHLHGGREGFHKKVWQAEPLESDEAVGVRLVYASPDGEEGYPGKLTTTVRYELTADNELVMDYTAVTDKPTVLNLTNHAYWNLGGASTSPDVLDHQLMINADQFLPTDHALMPLGVLESVADTPMDFRGLKTVGSRINQVEGGYDHCYVLNKPRGDDMPLAARLIDPETGRVMEVYTTQPGVQLYTANSLSVADGSGGQRYGKHAGLCLETQHFPDSPNHPDFPSTVLRPGERFHQRTVHKFLLTE